MSACSHLDEIKIADTRVVICGLRAWSRQSLRSVVNKRMDDCSLCRRIPTSNKLLACRPSTNME